MTTTQNLATVLGHHGIVAATTNALVDSARDHGILLACHGCGTVVAAPAGMTTGEYHAEQPWAREVLASGGWDCCPDADTTIF